MPTHQIRAHLGTIEALAADQLAHAGTVDGIRAALRQHAQQALAALDGGMGSEEHRACLAEIDRLVEEHLQQTQAVRHSTEQVGQVFAAGGQQVRRLLAAGG
jgi:hypothetical protein